MIILIILVLFVILPMWLAHKLAKRKNRNHRLWLLLTLFIGWVAVVILSLLTKKEQALNF